MRSISVITTFSTLGWHSYGKRMIDSFVKYWPKEIKLIVYYEEKPKDVDYGDQVQWVNFEQASPELVAYKKKHKTNPFATGWKIGTDPKSKYSYLWDAVKFAHKSFCVSHAALNSSTDIIIWLDADVVTHNFVSREHIESLLPQNSYCAYLGRKKIYPECGFVMYDCTSEYNEPFMKEWQELYTKDKLFKLAEYHDSYLFQHLVEHFEFVFPDFKHTSISGSHPNRPGVHVFINSPLGQYMDHLKGARKIKGKSKKEDLYVNRQEDYWKKV